MTTGNRVLASDWKREPALVEQFRGLPVANISDVMSRMTAGRAALRPYHDGTYLCGQAITVRTRPGDNLLVHKAISMARPGDVIVVDAGGDLTNAIIGEFMVAHARANGAAGFVIDGAIRDLGAIRAGDFPVYACGITHRGPYKDGPGEINVPISMAGLSVSPGDVIVGDEDGVLAITLADAYAVLKAARAKQQAEQDMWEAVRAGTNDRTWIDLALQRSGCQLP